MIETRGTLAAVEAADAMLKAARVALLPRALIRKREEEIENGKF